MKKLIAAALISIALMGCEQSLQYEKMEVTLKYETVEGCSYRIQNKEYDITYVISKCPCDRYEVGDNPFKCEIK